MKTNRVEDIEKERKEDVSLGENERVNPSDNKYGYMLSPSIGNRGCYLRSNEI